jgi:hypothetical protein
MSKLCNWNYNRYHYAILMYDKNGVKNVYYSPGLTPLSNPSEKLPELFKTDVYDMSKSYELPNCVINENEHISELVKKLCILSHYKYDSLYLYCGPKDNSQNMLFDYVYNINTSTARVYNYNRNILELDGYHEKFMSDKDWKTRANITRFDTSIISKYNYETVTIDDQQIRLIHCVPIDTYLQMLGGSSAYVDNKYQVMTYYPQLRDSVLKSHAKEQNFQRQIKYETSSLEYSELNKKLRKNINATGVINSNNVTNMPESDIVFYDCNVLEAMIHINYDLKYGSFVDVEKIFKMFTVTEEWPFSRLHTDKETRYYVHKSLTDATSPHYMDIRDIKDWIDPRVSSKLINSNDMYEINKLSIERNIGRGVSFKILNYESDSGRKYMTLNIYKDGKMELKCSWDEKYGTATNPGSNYELILESIEKVKRFIMELNMLQYHVIGSKIQKIPPPQLNISDPDCNTKIVFLNTVNMIDYQDEINIERLSRYFDHFNAYGHRIQKYINSKTVDYRNLEVRYNRIHNYIKLKSLHEHIKNYKENNPIDNLSRISEYNSQLIKDISTIFGIGRHEAALTLENYEEIYEGKKKKFSRKVVTGDDLSSLMGGRKINKQSGIRIKILKDEKTNLYKCLVLGVNMETLGIIYNFIKSLITSFKYTSFLLENWNIREPNYLYMLLEDEIKVEIDDDDISNQVKEIVAHKKELDTEYDLSDDDEFFDEDIFVSDDEDLEDEDEEEEKPNVANIVTNTDVKVDVGVSFLTILQKRDPRYAAMSKYSSSCQKQRQPLLIDISLSEALKEHVENQLSLATAKLERDPDNMKLKRIHREWEIHKKTLDGGVIYKNGYYFCPFTWNRKTHQTNDATAAFPPYEEAVKDKNYHAASKDKWKPGSDDYLFTTLKGDPPHNWYISFQKSLGSFPDDCYACCFAGDGRAQVDARNKCTSDTSVKIHTSSAKTYIKSSQKIVEENRYGFIDQKINKIFNREDSGKIIKAGSTIKTGFDYYLRKGVKEGNKFLNALSNINGKIVNAAKHIADYLRQVDNNIKIFKSLKRGAINQIFLPITDDTEKLDQALSDTTIVMENFISYLLSREEDINEDFIWDLVSRPGCIIPTGLNLIICEIKMSTKRSGGIESAQIKCPVGFNLDSLYVLDRPTLVLYKYGRHYEIITKVVSDDYGLHEYNLFDPGDPLINDIIDHIYSRCGSSINLKIKDEVLKHKTNHKELVEGILDFSNVITSSQAQSMIANLVREQGYPSSFNIKSQVIDYYNKVTHIILENDLILPVSPSGIMDDIPVTQKKDLLLSDVREIIYFMVQLASFEDFRGYMPYSFMLDPGEDYDNTEDDIIIGVILSNGLMIESQKVDVNDFLYDPRGTQLEVEREVRDFEIDPVIFDMKQLLFSESERWKQWYDGYVKADQELSKQSSSVVDSRKIYAVRSNFEQESYQRLRYELTRYFEVNEDLKQNVIQILDSGGENIRTDIFDLLQPVLEQLVIKNSQLNISDKNNLEQKLGPLEVSFENLTPDDYSKYEYSYVKPVIRYECFNPALNKFRGEDTHCVSQKLFINDINLISGNDDNTSNYLLRIIEEIIRIPLKRREILNNEMNNMVTDLHKYTGDAFYLSYDEHLWTNLKQMYKKEFNYKDRMVNHYDNANPIEYYKDSSTETDKKCIYKFRNLPRFWISKLKGMDWKYVDIQGPDNCIYNELDEIISEFVRDREVNTRFSVANIITGPNFKSYDKREPWEMARDHYGHIWRTDYKNVTSKEQLKNVIKYSDRHHLYIHDLSLISREYDVKFIIISNTNPFSRNGVTCLGTTQTKSDRYIILYQSTPYKFHVVKNVYSKPPRSHFTASEIPEVLFKEWVESCKNDNKQDIDNSNQIFVLAPVGTKVDPITGNTFFKSLKPDPSVASHVQMPLIQLRKPGKVRLVAPKSAESRPKMLPDQDPFRTTVQHTNTRIDKIQGKNIIPDVVDIQAISKGNYDYNQNS